MPFPFAGELAALATSVFFSIAPTFFALGSRLVGSAVVNLSRLLLATLILMAAHFFVFGGILPWLATPDQWFWFSLSGIIGLTLGDAALFQAFVQIGPRLTMLVFSLSPILTAVAGWAWFNETLTAAQILGISITLAGVLWVVAEEQNGGKTIDRRYYLIGLFFALLGAMGQAGGLVTAKLGLAGDFPVLSGQVIRLGVGTLVMWLFTLVRGKGREMVTKLREQPLAARYILVGTVAGPVFGIGFSLAAVKYTADIGVASTLQSLPPIFLLPIGYFFFKEKVTPRAILGTVVALAGVAILFLV
ncbi:MAG: DMT family transporter [Chloroflexi bacterium]|nr:DMT family transporter [Chloroflexota bacterium]